MAEVAVVGVPHEELAEEVRAVFALKEGESATEEEVITFARERVATYKYPRYVILWMTCRRETDTILKRELPSLGKAESNAASPALGS